MLCLRQQIGCHLISRRSVVGHHHGFRGAGELVYVHVPKDTLLGQHHEDIARTENLIHLGHCLGAVGQRRDGLGTADLEETVYPGNVRGDDHLGLMATIGPRRHGEHHLVHSGHASRNRGHQHRRGIGRGAEWGVEADALQWPDDLPEALVNVEPGGTTLVLVEASNPISGEPEVRYELRVHLLIGGRDLCRRRFQVGGSGAVEALGNQAESRIASAADQADHSLDELLRRQALIRRHRR